jgi:thiamine biosynthesis lipoprotein
MRWSNALATVLLSVLFTAALAECQPPSVYKKKYVMGTVFEVVVYDESSQKVSAAIDAAFNEATRLDGIMSNYKPESDLSRLNRTAHFQVQSVPPDLYRVIKESLIYSRLSGGKFDITVGPLVDYWKSVMRGERLESSAEEEKLRSCTGYEKITLLPPDRIEFHSSCLRIDLGAIGKGYAVDRMVEILRSNGITAALINAGGSTIYGMGSPPQTAGWRVRLRDPSGRNAPEVLLKDNSVSTSEQTAPDLLGRSNAGHIIDPETGEPVKTSAAVSALAKTGTASDALSTALLLLGPDRGASLVKSTATTAAIWITAAGKSESVSSGPRISIGESAGSDVAARAAGIHREH